MIAVVILIFLLARTKHTDYIERNALLIVYCNGWHSKTECIGNADTTVLYIRCLYGYRDQSRYAPNQWETLLQCDKVSHWLGTYQDWSLWLPWFRWSLLYGRQLKYTPTNWFCFSSLLTKNIFLAFLKQSQFGILAFNVISFIWWFMTKLRDLSRKTHFSWLLYGDLF